MLAYVCWGRRFDSRSSQKFLFKSSHQFSASVSATLTLDIGLFFIFLSFLHSLLSWQVLSSFSFLFFGVQMYTVNKCTFCFYSLFLSLCKTVAVWLQWRKKKVIEDCLSCRAKYKWPIASFISSYLYRNPEIILMISSVRKGWAKCVGLYIGLNLLNSDLYLLTQIKWRRAFIRMYVSRNLTNFISFIKLQEDRTFIRNC